MKQTGLFGQEYEPEKKIKKKKVLIHNLKEQLIIENQIMRKNV